jgi:hypothetical protein
VCRLQLLEQVGNVCGVWRDHHHSRTVINPPDLRSGKRDGAAWEGTPGVESPLAGKKRASIIHSLTRKMAACVLLGGSLSSTHIWSKFHE